MNNISVRRIDDETMARLRQRAASHEVSMEEEVRRILQSAVTKPMRLGDLARETFGYAHGVELDLPPHAIQKPIDLMR